MGMFDQVDAPQMRCPGCGADLGFQSKNGGCNLSTGPVSELMEHTRETTRTGQKRVQMIGGCENCRWHVSVFIETGNDPIDYSALLNRRRFREDS